MRRLALMAALLPGLALAAPAGQIEAHVAGLRGGSGRLACALFHGPGGFPRDLSRVAQRAFAPLGSPCVFKGLAPGAYAVAVFHDDDGSGVLPVNLIGAPAKGYGVSNNHTHALSPPSFEESKVDLGVGEAKAIGIDLRY